MSDMVPEVLNAALDSLFTPKEPGELEYQGDDGLLYCRNCHTPVQCRVKLWGRDKIVPCLCRCQQEAMAEKKRQDELLERQRRIRQLKATGIQEKHLLEWNFDVAEDNKDIQMAKRYVEQWKKVKAENLGLLLWGDVGTGKSFVAACIANALLDQGIPVLMTNFSKILNQMGAMYSEERYRYIASFSNYSLLILDDLGIERSTEYALEQVYDEMEADLVADGELLLHYDKSDVIETDRTRYLLGAAEVSEIDQNGNECSINLFTLERTIDYVNENLTVVSIGGELVSALRLI